MEQYQHQLGWCGHKHQRLQRLSSFCCSRPWHRKGSRWRQRDQRSQRRIEGQQVYHPWQRMGLRNMTRLNPFRKQLTTKPNQQRRLPEIKIVYMKMKIPKYLLSGSDGSRIGSSSVWAGDTIDLDWGGDQGASWSGGESRQHSKKNTCKIFYIYRIL